MLISSVISRIPRTKSGELPNINPENGENGEEERTFGFRGTGYYAFLSSLIISCECDPFMFRFFGSALISAVYSPDRFDWRRSRERVRCDAVPAITRDNLQPILSYSHLSSAFSSRLVFR